MPAPPNHGSTITNADTSDAEMTVAGLRELVARFVAERDWKQFHTPKNLAMALAIEAAELMEHFQWLDQAESRDVANDDVKRDAAGEELADVICYALAMANELGLDVSRAMHAKMRKNELKYPASEYRGRWGDGDARGKQA
jgi:NTP pyrophosphatase (non-canonical NTP hydrolase)